MGFLEQMADDMAFQTAMRETSRPFKDEEIIVLKDHYRPLYLEFLQGIGVLGLMVSQKVWGRHES